MSHLELLKKYMAVVLAREGWAYLDESDIGVAGVDITDEEIVELRRIEKEIDDE